MKVPGRSSPLRLRWPLLVLLASIALTALAAFDAQRTVRAQNSVVSQATREFSSFAAWSYGQHLEERLSGAAREALGAVNHGDNLHMNRSVPTAVDLVHYLPYDESCLCHRTKEGPVPVGFVALRLGAKTIDVAMNTAANPAAGWKAMMEMGDMGMSRMQMNGMSIESETAAALPPGESKWLVDTLTLQVRNHPLADRGFGLVVGSVGSTLRVLSYTVMPTAYGDTLVYAAEYTPKQFTTLLGDVLNAPSLLPATFTEGRRNRDVIAVRVADGASHRILDSAPGTESSINTQMALPSQFGALNLDVMVKPERASALVIGGLPRSRLPFLLGLLALAAAMSLVAVAQIRRETELAHLRADFVSNVSHELRTPLAQIRLYLDTIRLGRASTPAQRDWSLGHIERETTRLNHLVENVLRFSRLGRPDIPPTAGVDVTAEARSIVEEFRPLAASRGAKIDAEIADIPRVMLRPDAIRQTLINLLDNAVKYGPAGQTIDVRLAPDGGDLRLSVTDEGAGVIRADRAIIWRPFSRGRTANGAAGSGIGLTIVRDIATQHGGRAWVEEGPNGGARFVVAIPMVPDAASATPREAAHSSESLETERETATVN